MPVWQIGKILLKNNDLNILFIHRYPLLLPTTRISGPASLGPTACVCCVPGMARLLNGDVWHYDTSARQSPDPPWRRGRIAEGKGVAAMCAWRKPEAKAWVDVQVCPVAERVEGRQIWGGARPGRVRNTGQSPLSVIWSNSVYLTIVRWK